MNEEVEDPKRKSDDQEATTEEKTKSAIMRIIEGCVSDVLAVVGKDNHSAGYSLCELLEEVVIVVKRRLIFSPRLEYLYASQLKAVQTRASTGDAIASLESNLREVQEFRATSLRTQEKAIEEIEEQIKLLEMDAHDNVVATRSKTLLDLDRMEKNSYLHQEKLEEQLLEKQLFNQQMEQNHMQMELELREKSKAIEAELLTTIQHYDVTMEDLQEKKNKIFEEEEKITKILLQKQEQFKSLEAQYKAIEEERTVEEEKKFAAIQAEFHREHSVRIIQKAWQHYKMKKMLKKAQKKGKRKKSTGKEMVTKKK